MIIVLLGETSSGKNYYLNELLNQDKSLTKVVTYTDRPMRDGEVEGVDYHFVDKEFMQQMIKDGDMLEHATYDVINSQGKPDKFTYGTHKLSFSNNDLNYLVILNPEGYKVVRKIYKTIPIVGFLIHRDDDLRCDSYCTRDSKANIDEFNRRNDQDKKKFLDVQHEFDTFIINNNDFNATQDRIKLIRAFIKAYKDGYRYK